MRRASTQSGFGSTLDPTRAWVRTPAERRTGPEKSSSHRPRRLCLGQALLPRKPLVNMPALFPPACSADQLPGLTAYVDVGAVLKACGCGNPAPDQASL